MYLYFEEYHYPTDLFNKEDVKLNGLVEVENKSKLKFQCVGYYYSTHRKDMVFILPKVFIVNHKAFGRYLPEEIVKIDSENNPLQEHQDDQFAFGLSVWIYQAIQHFKERNPKSEITASRLIQEPLSIQGEHSETFLDTILKLLKFHKDHRYLFTYITIVNNSGNNKISWSKTINKVQPIIKNNVPYYVEFKNKNKAVNFDEEIIVLFYSVLRYLQDKYRFKVTTNLNYKLLPASQIESMLQTGRGTRRLRQIRRKYFTDEMVALWKLLYVFFEQAEEIESRKYHDEYLLAYDFERIFEDMIDQLIGSDLSEFPNELKQQKDGKIVDHIYKDRSLINSEEEVYFVGDSKYYKEDTLLGKYSVYKQFTYAKNIIQYNIDVFNGDVKGEGLRYRDELTEGYNVTPNFFIRGEINPDEMSYSDMQLVAEKGPKDTELVITNRHFENRLFDRDTLLLKAYNINFLFVLSSYVLNQSDSPQKRKIRTTFRNDIIKTLNDRYDFYIVSPAEGIKEFVDKNFRQFIGKMYCWNDTQILMAYERGSAPEKLVSNTEWKPYNLKV